VVRGEFERSGRTYGYRRVHAELARQGVRVDDETVRTIMRERGLVPVQVRRRRGLTVAGRHAGPIPDLVGRDLTAQAPGVKMVGDITQVDTGEGPLYVATVIDCYSKAVLGWALDERYPAGLVCSALDMAALRIDLPAGAVFHSDRGSQPRFNRSSQHRLVGSRVATRSGLRLVSSSRVSCVDGR
jgi:putative transposase